METLICRMLMVSGLLVGVMLAGGDGRDSVFPAALLALIAAGLLRRIAPSLPWRMRHGR